MTVVSPDEASSPPAHHARSDDYRWQGIEVLAYKESDTTFRAVTRQELTDARHGQGVSLRYFEIGPGGHTTLERHEHTHVVVPIRGSGSCLVGDQVVELRLHDVVFVDAWQWHQFRASDHEPLGFLCSVTVERDRPVRPTPDDLAEMTRSAAVASFIRS